MLWEASKKSEPSALQNVWQNDTGFDIIFDVPFTFLMRNVSSHAMLPGSTIIYSIDTRTKFENTWFAE